MEPRELAQRAEQGPSDFHGDEEQFSGYGIMGLPFASGHILGLRRFPASSVGPGYTSVWHRHPEGRWTFYSDVAPLQSCNRYFGNEVDVFQSAGIDLRWTGPRSLTIDIPTAALKWEVELAPSFASRLMNGMGRLMPDTLWRSGFVLDAMGVMASAMLGAGRVRLRGRAPNGQRFVANPRLIWTIPKSKASIGGRDLGPLGPVSRQASLGDFAITQRGIFAMGGAFFEPFDSQRHLAKATRSAG